MEEGGVAVSDDAMGPEREHQNTGLTSRGCAATGEMGRAIATCYDALKIDSLPNIALER